MRIRVRLTLYAITDATAGMLLFGVVLSALARGGIAEDQDLALGRMADGLARVIDSAGPAALSGREPLIPADAAQDIEAFLLVLDATGATTWSGALVLGAPIRIPASVVVEAADLGRSVATVHLGDEVAVRVVAQPWAHAESVGTVVAAQSMLALDEQVRSLNGFLMVAGLVAIVAVGLVSWLVVGRALRPLRTLSLTSDSIARTGDLTQRLPAATSRDEVGTLTRSFNGMLDRLAGSQHELGESLALQRRMVADASHELRTPLTTIRTNADTLRAHPEADPAERQAAVADIADEAARMSRLLDDLLLLARTDAGQRPITEWRPVDLAIVASDVARKATTPDRPVTLVRSGPLVVAGDPDALTRLIWILVENALRHGAGEVTITSGHLAADEPQRAWLSVSDHGPGFAPGDDAHVFERFWRADRSRSGPGSGLGLAIAWSIVDAHGGTITATNRDGGGAVLTARLPDPASVSAQPLSASSSAR